MALAERDVNATATSTASTSPAAQTGSTALPTHGKIDTIPAPATTTSTASPSPPLEMAKRTVKPITYSQRANKGKLPRPTVAPRTAGLLASLKAAREKYMSSGPTSRKAPGVATSNVDGVTSEQEGQNGGDAGGDVGEDIQVVPHVTDAVVTQDDLAGTQQDAPEKKADQSGNVRGDVSVVAPETNEVEGDGDEVMADDDTADTAQEELAEERVEVGENIRVDTSVTEGVEGDDDAELDEEHRDVEMEDPLEDVAAELAEAAGHTTKDTSSERKKKRKGSGTAFSRKKQRRTAAAASSIEYRVKDIIDESETEYLITWAGKNPATKANWPDTWEPKSFANDVAIDDWLLKNPHAQDPRESASTEEYRIDSILDEDDTRYLISWAGINPETRKKWPDSWEPKEYVNENAVRTWRQGKGKRKAKLPGRRA